MSDNVLKWRGLDAIGSDGEKLGTIEEIYMDEQTGQLDWALLNTGFLGLQSTFVPLEGARPTGEVIQIAYDKATVKDAPNIGGEMTGAEEDALYRHYGRHSAAARDEAPDRRGEAPGRREDTTSLDARERELQAREEELRERELRTREDRLSAREAELARREEEAAAVPAGTGEARADRDVGDDAGERPGGGSARRLRRMT